MAKVAIITDLHWGVRNNSPFFLQKQKDFYYNQFFPYLEQNNIKNVWIFGDVLENRKQINVQILNEVNNFFNFLQASEIDTVCLVGNHDTYFKNTNSVNSLVPITQAFEKIKLIETFDVLEFDGLSVGFISWISPEIRDQAINWLKTVNAQVICGHFEINSFEIVKGVVCSKGLEPSLFERFDKVLSGHFHIRATNGIIQYIGNPIQTNWGEYGFPKGFGVFDTASKNIQFIDNKDTIYEIVKYNDSIDIGNFDFSIYSNKIVRILINEYTNKKKLDALLEGIINVAYNIELIEDKEIIVDSNNENDIPTDTIHLISQFLDSCKIDHLNRSNLDQIIIEIYKDALERSLIEC